MPIRGGQVKLGQRRVEHPGCIQGNVHPWEDWSSVQQKSCTLPRYAYKVLTNVRACALTEDLIQALFEARPP